MVSGELPALGKTTWAKSIAKEFRLPLFTKDQAKEILFDQLESGLNSQQALGVSAFKILFAWAESLVTVGENFVMEGNFHPDFGKKDFEELMKKYPSEILQLHLSADAEIVVERFIKRAQSGERHPGHQSLLEENIASLEQAVKIVEQKPLDIPCQLIQLDTTKNFGMEKKNNIFDQIDNFLHK